MRKNIQAFVLVALAATSARAAERTVCPSGCQYTNLQSAQNGAPAGTVIRVKAATYQHGAGSGSTAFVTVSQSGITVIGEEGVVFRGRRVIADNDTSSAANASGASGDRAPIIQVTGNDVLLEGLEVTNSNVVGIAVTGDRVTLRGIRSHDNWLAGVTFADGADDPVIEFSESYENVHGSGFGGGPRNKTGSTATVRRARFRWSWSHDNGKYRNAQGQLVKSPGIDGDRDGGGNSDGSGSSKACAKNVSANTCPDWSWDGIIATGNSDDAFDNSAQAYRMSDIVAENNGPIGCRTVKVLNNTAGNTWERILGFRNNSACPSGKDHGIEVTSSGGSVIRNSRAYRIIIGGGVADGGGNTQGLPNQPAGGWDPGPGRPWQRFTELWRRLREANPILTAAPAYPGETTEEPPPPPPDPVCVDTCPNGGVLQGALCVVTSSYQPVQVCS